MKNLNTNDMEKVNGGGIGLPLPKPRRPLDPKKFIKRETVEPKDDEATGDC